MSAFQVSNAHISVLVFAREFVDSRLTPFYRDSETDLGRALVRENVLSCEHRYPSNAQRDHVLTTGAVEPSAADFAAEAYFYKRPAKTPDVVTMLKAIDCYEYQSCEHPGWKTSHARDYCAEVRRNLIPMLPGYSDAPWGIS